MTVELFEIALRLQGHAYFKERTHKFHLTFSVMVALMPPSKANRLELENWSNTIDWFSCKHKWNE